LFGEPTETKYATPPLARRAGFFYKIEKMIKKGHPLTTINLRTAVDPVSSPFFSMLALGWVGLAHSPDG
jgi:hypothetical protein